MVIRISRTLRPDLATGDRALAMRLGQLGAGTIAMGVGIAALMWSRLGMVPMDVLHLGLSHAAGWTFGGGIIAGQSLLLMTFVPLRIRPGIGTVAGFVIPAVVADLLLGELAPLGSLAARTAALLAGVVLFCAGVAVYLLADLGRLPRDGVMLALSGGRQRAREARPLRVALVRMVIDAAFIGAGVALLGPAAAVQSGALSVGTLLLATGCGPLIALLLRLFAHGFKPNEGALRSQCQRGSPSEPAAPRRGGRH